MTKQDYADVQDGLDAFITSLMHDAKDLSQEGTASNINALEKKILDFTSGKYSPKELGPRLLQETLERVELETRRDDQWAKAWRVLVTLSVRGTFKKPGTKEKIHDIIHNKTKFSKDVCNKICDVAENIGQGISAWANGKLKDLEDFINKQREAFGTFLVARGSDISGHKFVRESLKHRKEDEQELIGAGKKLRLYGTFDDPKKEVTKPVSSPQKNKAGQGARTKR